MTDRPHSDYERGWRRFQRRTFRALWVALAPFACALLLGGSAVASSGCEVENGDGGGGGGGYAGCCKVCDIGKACGDTCISRDYDCHVGPGCACNA